MELGVDILGSEFSLFFDTICAIMKETKEYWGDAKMFEESYDGFLENLIKPSDRLYQISNYQRFYVWSTEKVKTLFDDICIAAEKLERDPGFIHFFGQIILYRIGNDRRGRVSYEVIDGQQRLSTFIMLIAAIIGDLSQIAKDFPATKENVEDAIAELKPFLSSTMAGTIERSKLTLSPRDNDYFQHIISALSKNELVRIEKSPISHDCLYKAQKCLKQELQKVLESIAASEEEIAKLKTLASVAASKLQTVVITAKEEKYTYQLYQVVNDRGEPLKDSELLKAKSIEVLDGNQDAITEARSMWDEILNDPGNETEDYLKWCYMSKLGADKKSSERYYHVYINNYFHIPRSKELTVEQQSSFLASLRELYADILLCRKLSKGIWPFDNTRYYTWQTNVLKNLIVSMNHTLCIPVLISAFHQPDLHGVTTEDNFYKCLEIIETFFILFKGVFQYRETKFKTKYLTAAANMRVDPSGYRASSFQNDLAMVEKNTVPRDCLIKMQSLSYAPKAQNSYIRYLLLMLELYNSSFDEHDIPHTARVRDGIGLVFPELSIEHIYSEKMPQELINPSLETVKHQLGNLVLYGGEANSSLPLLYEDKRHYYQSSGISTAIEIANGNEHWTIDEFDRRHTKICTRLTNLLLRFYPRDN